MQHSFIYDLGFIGPTRRPRTAPEIVFQIEEQHLPELIDRLHSKCMYYHDYIDDYFGANGAALTLPTLDLFGNREFGFVKCGYCTVDNGMVSLRLPLRPYPWTHYTAMTICILTMALSVPFAVASLSKREQDVVLKTRACQPSQGYGHATGGWLSARVIAWLRSYARSHQEPIGVITEASLMHPAAIRAMQAAAGAMISSKRYGYRASSQNVNGWIRTTGAFTLYCFGNACDLSIYPDQVSESELLHDWFELACHNLDSAEQQLTLLAGLATLCQLARSSS